MLYIIFLMLLGQVEAKSPFEQKSMQPAISPNQASRPLILPKGWMEFTVEMQSKYATAQRDFNNEITPLGSNQYWSYSQLWFNYSNAFSSRLMVYMHVPFVHAQFQPSDGDAIATTALGDVHTGFYYQPTLERQNFVVQVDLKSPSGVEWPSSKDGGPNDISGFLTGTGLTNLGFIGHYKVQPSALYALHIQTGYTFKFPAIVGYVVEKNGFGNGILNAGNEFNIAAVHQVQIKPTTCLEFTHQYSHRAPYFMGVSGEGIRWHVDEEILGAGWFVNVGAGLSWESSPMQAYSLHIDQQVLGTSTTAFALLGLEEFSPQPGTTISLKGSRRW